MSDHEKSNQKTDEQFEHEKGELEERAGYKLVQISHKQVGTIQHTKTKFSLNIPIGASKFHIGVFNGAPEQQNGNIPLNANGPGGRPGYIVAKSNEEAHSLSWPLKDHRVKVSLYQYGPHGYRHKLFTAVHNQQSTDITPEIRKRSNDFCLKVKRKETYQPYEATVRFFVAVTDGILNLEEVDQESKNILTRAIEHKTLSDDINNGNGGGNKCVVQ